MLFSKKYGVNLFLCKKDFFFARKQIVLSSIQAAMQSRKIKMPWPAYCQSGHLPTLDTIITLVIYEKWIPLCLCITHTSQSQKFICHLFRNASAVLFHCSFYCCQNLRALAVCFEQLHTFTCKCSLNHFMHIRIFACKDLFDVMMCCFF